MEDLERYERARKRVENLKAFYIHLTVFILVNILLLIINLLSSPGHWWFIYPLLGWGIGLGVHGITTLTYSRFGSEWEKKKIQEYIEKDK